MFFKKRRKWAVLIISNAAYYGMALKAFFDASQTPVFDALGLTAQFVAFEAISSGEVSTFTLNDMLRAGSLDNDFPKIF